MHKIAIIGLGYVGLPLAYYFDKAGHTVIGFDISQKKIDELRNGIDSTNEVGSKIKESNIVFTLDINDIQQAEYIIVTVPTPINKQKLPDFTPLQKSSESIGSILQPGQIVVYESTVYPGCTEEICLPILEKQSGLSCPQDFQIGYSPERINPGDKKHTLDKIIKVVAGIDDSTGDKLVELYGSIITAGIHKAPTIAVAEAAKIIENTQRDINIALMNELKQIFDKSGINTHDVLAAAGTKWNFLNFYPGLVGGHCIGVDPYWLAYKAQGLGINPEIILAGRRINDEYPLYVASQIIKRMTREGININGSKMLVLGLTFKPDVPDFRNSKVGDVIKEIQSYGCEVYAYDPYIERIRDYDLVNFGLTRDHILHDLDTLGTFACVLKAVDHKTFTEGDLAKVQQQDTVFLDMKEI